MGELQEIDVFGQIWATKTPLKYIGYTYNLMGQKDVQTITEVNTIDSAIVDFNTYYYYDSQDRINEVRNAQGSIAGYFYDSAGRKVGETSAADMLTRYNYDTFGNLVSVVEDVEHFQRTTSYGYDRKGRKTSITSGSDSTLYNYNYLDKIDAIDYPDNMEIIYGYDMEGNITSRTITKNSQSVVTYYKRNPLGKISYKQFSNDPNWADPNTAWPFDEILYDAAGNKWLSAYINNNRDMDFGSYDYDSCGNLVNASSGHNNWNYSVSYGYDPRGFLISMTYPDGNSVAYERDALGRVETVKYDGNDIASYYWLGDTAIAKTLGNIQYTAIVDSLGRIASEGYGGVSYNYDYHNHTNRLTDRNSADYGYDTLGRVTSEDSTNYSCDILGNPTNASDDDLTYTTDNEDRVTQVADGSNVIVKYSYDHQGKRTSKTVDDVNTYFAYDKFGNVIAEYIQDGNDMVWQKNYIYGGNGELVYVVKIPKAAPPVVEEENEDLDNLLAFLDAWLCNPYCSTADLEWDYNSDSQINFVDWAGHCGSFENAFPQPDEPPVPDNHVLTDFKGSVVGMTDSNDVFIEIGYNAWGTPSYTGDLEGLNVLWNGYYFDNETGNYYLRNRYYSPLERKFVTQDPRGINPDENWENYFNIPSQYGDGYSLTAYCKSDPINKSDIWGLSIHCDQLRRLADQIRASGEEDIDTIRKLYETLAYGRFTMGHRQAGKNLEHWLSGVSTDLNVSSDWLLSDNKVRDIRDKLTEQIKGMISCSNSSGTTGNVQKGVYPVSGTDVYYGTGWLMLNANGTYTNGWFCSKCERKLKVHFSMRDPYDWHEGLSVTACGVVIPDSWALKLQQHDNLHIFNITADWNENIGCVSCKPTCSSGSCPSGGSGR